MIILTLQTVIFLLYIFGFAWSVPENTTLQVSPGTGTITPPGNNSSTRPETRIIGGVNAGEYEFPHHVFITQTIGRKFRCGGSILTADYVLTAGSCIDKDITITAGSYILFGDVTRKQFRYNFENIFVHRCYNRTQVGDLRYDIAIIKLREPFVFDESVRPPLLAPTRIDVANRAKVGTSVTAIGWGRTGDVALNFYNSVLQKVQLTIINEDECNKTLQSPFLDKDSQICTSHNVGSVCVGDEGGSLICSENNRYVCGITSFVNCSSGPSIYTRVSYFKDWINGIIKSGRDSSKECGGSLITSNGFSYFLAIFTVINC